MPGSFGPLNSILGTFIRDRDTFSFELVSVRFHDFCTQRRKSSYVPKTLGYEKEMTRVEFHGEFSQPTP